jgi:hypothetical protein
LKDSSNTDIEILKKLASDFESKIGSYPKIYSNYCKRGGYGFDTIIRSTVLAEIMLNLICKLRKQITNTTSGFEDFSNAFFAKLLTGDGSISINKKNILGSVRIKIYDENVEYLEDYSKIMKNIGFNYTRLDKKHNCIEANCTLDNLLYLYKIEAFKNTNNWNKLLVIIGFYLNGKRVKIRLRLFDFLNKIFTSKDITKTYSLHPEDRKWLNNMIKKGFIVRVNDKTPFEYKITEKSEEFVSTINKWKNDLNNLIKARETASLSQLWNSLKVH